MGCVDHAAHAAAGDQLNALADQARIAIHHHPFHSAAWPHAATIGGAFGGIAVLKAIIGGGAVPIVLLLCLVLLLLRQVLPQLSLILLLLCLILGIVSRGFGVHGGVFGADLI